METGWGMEMGRGGDGFWGRRWVREGDGADVLWKGHTLLKIGVLTQTHTHTHTQK